ncbi:glutamate--tRNA ligase [Candidatus Peregrinibacteria bacterium]|nr:glutamate--tRNA ligase [Candidatus Peregrinibacteria bacterium]
MPPMRTRFAPSPTGFLHIGGLRTALYAYLVAKQTGGEFLLRIEDTDQERSVPGAVENILSTLHFAGLDPDQKPVIQSERLPLYKKYAAQLQRDGYAYPCFCTQGRLNQMRKDQMARKEAPMYDRLCCALSQEQIKKRIEAGEPHVLRLKIPREGKTIFDDDIRGTVEFKNWVVDDQVLLKSDGFPTYHLAHVVDDHLMDIGLVIRGEEWLSSLPKHLLLFQYLGWKPPRYAHVPLILNKDKSKLSKRQSDVAVEDYIQNGYLPEALLNFVALLGWNSGTPQDIFSLKELIDQFSIERVQKHGAVFDTDKLNWLQGQWIRKIPTQEFAERIRPLVEKGFSSARIDEHFLERAALVHERITFFNEAPDMMAFFYQTSDVPLDVLLNKKQHVTEANIAQILQTIIHTLENISDWSPDALLEQFRFSAEKNKLKLGQLLWPLRAILTGKPFSPGATEVASALGKEETMRRLKNASYKC